MILESGYCGTDLARNANNCFGMKANLSGNTWKTVWDGSSVYGKVTEEQDRAGNAYRIFAEFRKYPCVEDSIRDHSLYLLGAMNGSRLRYEGLTEAKDYRTAIRIIKNGGYATDTKYIDKICSIIERYDLAKYDPAKPAKYYRVRKTWEDTKSQKGAYKILENAKKCADENPGYSVFDGYGKAVYTSAAMKEELPFLVRVSIPDLIIRGGPGASYASNGYTGIGVFTIVAVSGGWGKLKSGAGWISLKYCEKI
jgi:hypothetical protein